MAGTTDEATRVRDYLVSQANKLSVPELVAKVRGDCAPLEAAGNAVPASRFSDRPSPEDWSAAEVYTHILRMNEWGAEAITTVLDGGVVAPSIADTISGETVDRLATAAAYWDAYVSVRGRLLERVLRTRGDEHLDAKIAHLTFGELTWREWLLFMRVHDIDHMRQLEKITSAFTRFGNRNDAATT